MASPDTLTQTRDVNLPAQTLFRQEAARPIKLSGKLLNKPVETLAIVPKRERLTVLARKVYNVLMYVAQSQGAEQESYVMPLRELAKAANFNSNDTAILKEHVAQLITTIVDWQSPTRGEGAGWKISTLLSEASINMHGGENFVRWSYSPSVRNEIMAPNRYSRISMLHQAAMRSVSGLALYEICMRYINNPGGMTARQHWTWWRPVLTGTPADQVETYAHYKYFKRDVLKGAVAEVNAITDLEVALIEHRQGRSVFDLQFSVKRKLQSATRYELTPDDLPAIGLALKHGVSQKSAEKLIAKHGTAEVVTGLNILAERKSDRRQPDVLNPANYLGAVLSNQQSVAEFEPTSTIGTSLPQATIARATLIDQYRSMRRSQLQALFKEFDEPERNLLLNEFGDTVVPSLPRVVKAQWDAKKIQNPMIRSHFFTWYAEKLWGKGWDEPSGQELLEFVSPSGSSTVEHRANSEPLAQGASGRTIRPQSNE